MVAATDTLSNGIAYDGIVLRFCKHLVNNWITDLLNPIYGQKMPVDKHNSLYTNSSKRVLKADVMDLINNWFLAHAQAKSKNTSVSPGTTNLKILLKKDNSFLMVLYGTVDWERLDTAEDLKLCINTFEKWKIFGYL